MNFGIIDQFGTTLSSTILDYGRFTPPVSELLSLGPLDPSADKRPIAERMAWYARFRITTEQLAELRRLALLWSDVGWIGCLEEHGQPEEDVWGPVHSWYVLASLPALAGVPTLLEVLRIEAEDDGDWGLSLIPQLLTEQSLAVLPLLADFLNDRDHCVYSRMAIPEVVEGLALRHPGSSQECVNLLTWALAPFRDNEPELNAALISSLIGLNAVDQAPLIAAAFDAQAVEESICGDKPYVLYKLGAGPKPPPRRFGSCPSVPEDQTFQERLDRTELRARRKRERKAKKRARKAR
jgi:hypothetical protein